MNKVNLPRPCAILDAPHNPADPNPWQTLWLDQSIPINKGVKQAWLRDSITWSRQFVLPFVRPLARLSIVLLQIVKTVIPTWLSSSTLLHQPAGLGTIDFCNTRSQLADTATFLDRVGKLSFFKR